MTSPFDLLNQSEKDQVVAEVHEYEEKYHGGKNTRWKVREAKKNEFAKGLLNEKKLSNTASGPTFNHYTIGAVGDGNHAVVTTSPAPELHSTGKGYFSLKQFMKNIEEHKVGSGNHVIRDEKEEEEPPRASPVPELRDEKEEEEPPGKRLKSILRSTLKYSKKRQAVEEEDMDKRSAKRPRYEPCEEDTKSSRVKWDKGVVHHETLPRKPKTWGELRTLVNQGLRELRKVRKEKAQHISRLESENMNLEGEIFSLRGECDRAHDATHEAWGIVDRSHLEITYLESENNRLCRELDDTRKIINCLRVKYDI